MSLGCKPVRDATWQYVCERPRIYHCQDFLTQDECEAVLQMAKVELSEKGAQDSMRELHVDNSENNESGNVSPEAMGPRRHWKYRVDLDVRDPPKALKVDDIALLRSIARRADALSGVRTHSGELPWAVHMTPAQTRGSSENDGDASHRLPFGLHVDTNNCRDRRWLTYIVYLNSIPSENGGHTVFPLASRSTAGQESTNLLDAAGFLLSCGMNHTGRPGATSLPWRPEGADIAAQRLLKHASHVADSAACQASPHDGMFWCPSGVGAAVPVVRGSCVAFFTRSSCSDGDVDAFSWHGGAAIEANKDGMLDHCEGKWTLQMFREIPVFEQAKDADRLESFARKHSALNPCCGGGVRFDVMARHCGSLQMTTAGKLSEGQSCCSEGRQ